MKSANYIGLLITVLFFAAPCVSKQMQRQPRNGADTWYEFLLKQFNPHDVDYGALFEKRREALLAATAKEPYFWYSLSVTAGMLLMMAAYTKLYLDHCRSMRVTAEMMADVYSQDILSRQAATEAIEKYNHHIEQCNRAIEASEAGGARLGWGETPTDSLKGELQRVTSQLEATTQERNKFEEELRQKALIVADLSIRLDVLSKKINGPRDKDSGTAEPGSTSSNGDGARIIGPINRLQEELYAERQKNRRLKGA